jgi:hypothetical protein
MRLQIKDIRKGDLFAEFDDGMYAEFEAVADASRVGSRKGSAGGWEAEGKCIGSNCDFIVGAPCRFFVADEAPGYGPYLERI